MKVRIQINNNQMNTVRASFIVIGAFAAAMTTGDESKLQVRKSGSAKGSRKSRDKNESVSADAPEIWSQKPLNPPETRRRSREREREREGEERG